MNNNRSKTLKLHVFKVLIVGLALCLIPLSGCKSYKGQTNDIKASYQQGQFEKAKDAFVKQAEKKSKTRDALVWKLEEASALRTANYLKESTKALEEADAMISEFEEKADTRLGQETISAFTNPANITYEGWTSEHIMVSTYLALNSIIAGETDKARVYLNKAYQRQRDAVEKNAKRIEKEQEEIAKQENASSAISDAGVSSKVSGLYGGLDKLAPIGDYVNPFTSYLRGLFFMYNAADSSDLETAVKSLQQTSAFAKDNTYVQKDLETAEKLANGGSLQQSVTYVIFENGQGPYLEQVRVDLPLPISGGIYPANVAFPVFKTYGNQNNRLKAATENGSAETQLISSMDDVFGADFNSEKNRITSRIIAGVVIKQAASIAANQALDQTGNAFAKIGGGLALSAAQTALNVADTRSWTLLPGNFQVCCIPTPENKTLKITESSGKQSETVQLSDDGINLVYVQSVAPGLKMNVWTAELAKIENSAAPAESVSESAPEESVTNVSEKTEEPVAVKAEEKSAEPVVEAQAEIVAETVDTVKNETVEKIETPEETPIISAKSEENKEALETELKALKFETEALEKIKAEAIEESKVLESAKAQIAEELKVLEETKAKMEAEIKALR